MTTRETGFYWVRLHRRTPPEIAFYGPYGWVYSGTTPSDMDIPPVEVLSKRLTPPPAEGLRVMTSHERSVLDAAAQLKLIREKSSRPPFVESVVCRGGGKLLVDAEWARREALGI